MHKDEKSWKCVHLPAADIRHAVPCVAMAVLTLFACWLFVGRFGIFGAKVDWISQHSVIPELFRQQFYDTGNIFPDFTLQAGGGQNIYNFAYYGLYSPAILLSYLLPFVQMSDYIIVASIASILLSVLLLYYWLERKGFDKKICFCVSLFFLLAGPVIVQSYSQIMFVDYLPWLLAAFLGADRYLDSRMKKPGLFVFGITGMILTSFYFSIGGMLSLGIYGIHRYLEREEIHIKTFAKFIPCYVFLMWISVLLSGLLLVPAACALMQGRHENPGYSWKDLLCPELPLKDMFYQPYGIGLTTLFLTVLLTGFFYRKWQEKFLSISVSLLLVIPAFTWLLNGGLYIRGKVWIPFLPLYCYMIALYIKKQKEHLVSTRISMAIYQVTLFLVWWKAPENCKKWLLLEALLLLLCYAMFLRKNKREELWLLLPSICFLALFQGIAMPAASRVVEPAFYKEVNDSSYQRLEQKLEQKIEKEAKGMYRIEEIGNSRFKAANLNRIWGKRQYLTSLYSSAFDADYQEFRQKTFGLEQPFRNRMMQSVSVNPDFQSLMGVRYILSKQEISGCRKIMEDGKVSVYENTDALPMAYAIRQTISRNTYESLKWPYNQMIFAENTVVEKKTDTTDMAVKTKANVKKLSISGTDWKVCTKKQTKKMISLEKEASSKEILYLRFQVKNHKKKKDMSAWLNGCRNKLTAENHIYYNDNTTFTYAVPLKKGDKTAELLLGAGDYEVKHLEAYIGERQKSIAHHAFQADKKKTKGNQIEGTVKGYANGYFVTSIPYDPGFQVTVDGKKVETEKVNTAFLGFPLTAGSHHVKIVYHAPGKKVGMCVSLVGLFLLAGWMTVISFTNKKDTVIIPLHGQKAGK